MGESHIPFDAACRVLGRLRELGYEAWLAGGCVRDLLLGREPHDFDVATSATPDVVLGAFPCAFAVGAHFGVVLVAFEDADDAGRSLVEVATFRNDGAYSDGRRPDSVRYTQSPREDVLRRDFTINGLLFDPLQFFGGVAPEWEALWRTASSADRQSLEYQRLRAAVLDHVQGLDDLERGVVRAIGQPALRFQEDRLRMLRAVRFAARLDFAIAPETGAALKEMAAAIASVSRERVRDELNRMLTEGRARRAFALLDETGLLAQVLPEVARMKGVEQPPEFHPEGGVWAHTLLLLDQLERDCPLTLAWGALLHDVGKPATFRRADRIRFDGHAEVGGRIAADICARFRFSNEETDRVVSLVEQHMRFIDAPRMKPSTLKRFFRLDAFPQHLALHKMDCLASKGNLTTWQTVQSLFAAMPAEAIRPKPLLTGDDLIAAGYTPGPSFKEMLRQAEDAQMEGQIHTREEALHWVGRSLDEARN